MDQTPADIVPQETPETVKVGEKEYTQDELNNIVQLGETARDYETKWNRKVSEFYPDYTQKSQKLAEFERAEDERRKSELESKLKKVNN